jgi:hypothetical protein
MSEPRPPHYRELVNELVRRHWQQVSKPGAMTEARIAHDDWCPIWNGGSCCCCPEVILIDRTEGNAADKVR